MLSRFVPFVALRYLRSKRKEVFISIITIISVLGVAISVMVLDIVLAVMTGFESELRSKLVGATAHVVVRQLGGDMEDWRSVREKILKIEGVTGAYPYTYQQAMVTTSGAARGVLIRGVVAEPGAGGKIEEYLQGDAKIEDLFEPATLTIRRPDGALDDVNLSPLLIGRELQRTLGVTVGQPVTLLAPKLTSAPQGLIPKQRRFVVVGTYSSGLVEYENGLAYTSLGDAQNFFGLGSGVTGIEVDVDDLFKAKQYARTIVDAITTVDTVYYATDWTEPNKPLWEAIKLEKRVYFIVLLLLILVASFSIVSTLVMVVMEKGKDIAILKSMGASDGSVMRIFLLHGALIGFVGTALGTLLGYLGAIGLREYGFEIDEKVFSLREVPVHIVPENFVMVAIAGLVITALAGVYPARRASKLNPVEALRFE